MFLIAVLSTILLIGTGVGFYLWINNDETVHIQMINDEQQLSLNLIKWKNEKNKNKGIHIYSFDNSTPYKIIVYYNNNLGKNIYSYSVLQAKIVNETLKLEINDQMATDDSFVKDKILALVTINERPKNISVFINDIKAKYTFEKGIK